MKILIVDDEYYSAMGIQKQLLNSDLQLSVADCAFSLAQAKKRLLKEGYDILITDIQMPKGDGLELVAWCKEHDNELVCIFLTAFASFDYAKRAVELHGFDYLLKPVFEDKLVDCVQKAINKAQEIKEHKAKQAQADYWHQAYPKLIEKFWLDLGRKVIQSNDQDIKDRLIQANLPLTFMENQYLLLMIRFWNQTDFATSTLIALENLKKEVQAIFPHKEHNDVLILELEDATCLLMLEARLSKPYIQQVIQGISERSLRENQFITYICASEAVNAHSFAETFDHLFWQIKNRFSPKGDLEGQVKPGVKTLSASTLPLAHWSELIHRGQSDQLLREVSDFLDGFRQSPHFTRNDLVLFYHDYLQVLYAAMETYKASPSQMMDGYIYQDCVDNACGSISDMQQWIKKTLDDFQTSVRGNSPVNDAVADTIHYIKEHLDEPLERDHLSALVFVSPDHLSHLFRQQKGLSLSAYILEQRLDKARELLLTTRKSIREIAFASGFQNESYFISQFKRKTGKTPLNYRKKG